MTPHFCLGLCWNRKLCVVNRKDVRYVAGQSQELEQRFRWRTRNEYCYCASEFLEIIGPVASIIYDRTCLFYGYLRI